MKRFMERILHQLMMEISHFKSKEEEAVWQIEKAEEEIPEN